MAQRHWKQRYNAESDMIFSRRMKVGVCGLDVVHPGDDVPQAFKDFLGPHRLRRWWESRLLELARFDGNSGVQLPRPEPKTKAKKKESPFG